MRRQRDRGEIESLQTKAMLLVCGDQQRATAMLLNAAKAFVGEDKWRATLWDAMKERLTPPSKSEGAD